VSGAFGLVGVPSGFLVGGVFRLGEFGFAGEFGFGGVFGFVGVSGGELGFGVVGGTAGFGLAGVLGCGTGAGGA
jgi:hypothetical protein